jgi:hypothetical protein
MEDVNQSCIVGGYFFELDKELYIWLAAFPG